MDDKPSFADFPEAFAYARQMSKPVVVWVALELWKVFPSGRAEPLNKSRVVVARERVGYSVNTSGGMKKALTFLVDLGGEHWAKEQKPLTMRQLAAVLRREGFSWLPGHETMLLSVYKTSHWTAELAAETQTGRRS